MLEDAREWDAAAYDRIAEPQTRWGADVAGWLELDGHERILDAGCGSGRVTEMVLERDQGIHIVALDASAAMITEARRRLARFGERVTYVVADLARPLPVEGLVDAVLSTATFHWVRDHDALFANLAAVMRPGAQLVAQCGGPGNVEGVMSVLRDLGRPSDVVFPTPEETRDRLERAGFDGVETWLHRESALFETDEAFHAFLRTVVLREQLASMDHDGGSAFVDEVRRRLPSRDLGYVRLNIRAHRR